MIKMSKILKLNQMILIDILKSKKIQWDHCRNKRVEHSNSLKMWDIIIMKRIINWIGCRVVLLILSLLWDLWQLHNKILVYWAKLISTVKQISNEIKNQISKFHHTQKIKFINIHQVL